MQKLKYLTFTQCLFKHCRLSGLLHHRTTAPFFHLFHVAIPNALHVGTQKPATNIPKQQRTKVNSQHIKKTTTQSYDTVCYSQSYIPHLSIVNSLPSNFHFGIKLLAVQTQLTVVKIINISTYTFMEYKSNTSQKV